MNTFKDLFYIIKGQHRRVGPTVETTYNSGKGVRDTTVLYLGGYDPTKKDTNEWYVLCDTETRTCHCASSDLRTVLCGLYKAVIKYRTRDTYVATTRKHMVATSAVQEALEKECYNRYGHYYKDLCNAVAERAYQDLMSATQGTRRGGNVLVRRRAMTQKVNDMKVDVESVVSEVMSSHPVLLTPAAPGPVDTMRKTTPRTTPLNTTRPTGPRRTFMKRRHT